MAHVPPTQHPHGDTRQQSPVEIGEILAGKYRVERVLGVGGMGVVVAATNLGLDQMVALKFMLPQMLSNKDAVARFIREAKAAVKLRSEHVGRVLDVGTLENGAPYIMMEYLEGQDLSSVIHARGPVPIHEATGYILQAIDAIAEAHALGIVHRDLKPPNLFVSTRNDGYPLVKVLDFGISKAKLSMENLTSTSALMGSPGYMSPEQMRASREVDPRTDIWSLGVILYELVSGHLPFTADTMPELCVKILQDALPPLRQIAPTIPAEFEAVVSRCMEKDRSNRFANVAELALALESFAPPRERGTAERAAAVLRVTLGAPVTNSSASMPVVAGTGSHPIPAASTASASHSNIAAFPAGTVGDAVGQVATERPKRSRKALVAVIGGALVAGGVALALTMSAGKPGSDTVAPATTPAASSSDLVPKAEPAAPTPAPPPAPAPAPVIAPPAPSIAEQAPAVAEPTPPAGKITKPTRTTKAAPTKPATAPAVTPAAVTATGSAATPAIKAPAGDGSGTKRPTSYKGTKGTIITEYPPE